MKQFNIHDTALGKQTSTPEHYDSSLLFRIPRTENREKYGLRNEDLPFTGVDTWNCYEFSFLTRNGLPVSRIIKLVYPANSTYLVESKSLKLYLNSFNMERFELSIDDSEKRIKKIISDDLTSLLEVPVQISFFTPDSEEIIPFGNYQDIFKYVHLTKLESYSFSAFEEEPKLLVGEKKDDVLEYIFRTDLLRSNCRVTNQPDWGDLFVRISTPYEIDLTSIIVYIVSFRKENHFHEEVVEMIFKRLYDAFKPEKLMVAAMYTRRGGIDINPIRSIHADWLEQAFTDADKRLAKTWRQ